MNHYFLALPSGAEYPPDMDAASTSLTTLHEPRSLSVLSPPSQISAAGAAAEFAWSEFFSGYIRNRHTRAAYLHAVRRFLAWVEPSGHSLPQITPGMVGAYFDQHPGSIPTKKLHLAALRAFFCVLVTRHVTVLNPAATVRGERYQTVEGKTPEIPREQARMILASIDSRKPVGLRDRAIIATLIYTGARDGAVAALRLKDLQRDLLDYLACFKWTSEAGDSPLFRSIAGKTGQLTAKPIRNADICRMMKRRLRDAGLPQHFSPHSFRVTTVTDLLNQGVPLEDVQYLAGHADPRTTRLYDRRQRQVTRNTVERISI